MEISVTFVVFLVLLINSNNVVGELTVTATISDESAVPIGFGEFVTYQFYDSIEVSCRADPLPANGILTLFQDDRSLEVVEAPALDINIDLSSIDLNDNSERQIIFRCQLRVARDTIDEERANYIVENSVKLNLGRDASPFSLCASSIGSSGTTHESTYLLCATSLTSTRLMWSGQEALIADNYNGIAYTLSLVEVSMLSDPMVCIRRSRGTTSEVCRLPEFEIISEPTVSISPKSFPDSLDTVSITCESNPPSRIRWAVIGEYGNILDRDLIANLPGGEWNVSIEEITGTSTIILAGSVVTLLNINSVICVTYGRQYTKIGIAQRETNPGITPSATSMGSNDTSYIIVITILAMSTLILAVWCVLLYLRCKRSSESTKTSGDNLENINSAYEPYQPPEPASAPYMEVMNVSPSVQNANLYQEEPVDEDYQTPSL